VIACSSQQAGEADWQDSRTGNAEYSPEDRTGCLARGSGIRGQICARGGQCRQKFFSGQADRVHPQLMQILQNR
jgi:hypothetical protein